MKASALPMTAAEAEANILLRDTEPKGRVLPFTRPAVVVLEDVRRDLSHHGLPTFVEARAAYRPQLVLFARQHGSAEVWQEIEDIWQRWLLFHSERERRAAQAHREALSKSNGRQYEIWQTAGYCLGLYVARHSWKIGGAR